MRFKRKIQFMCKRPFPGYPHGCPQFGKNESCPPIMKLIDQVIDLEKDVYVIATEFDVRNFVEEKNGDEKFFDRKYWIDAANAEHKKEADKQLKKLGKNNLLWLSCPEGAGVEIASLTKQAKIELDWSWPPKNGIVWLVSLAGEKLFLEQK